MEENLSLIHIWPFEGKTVFALRYHVSFHVVVEKHSLLVGIQQQAVAAVRVDVIDVGMQQRDVYKRQEL